MPVTDGYPRIFVGMVLMGLGMGLAMAPATESIMGSLPPAKAGVGSAMNDTTRQMGGALGVAIIGSVFASVFRPGIADDFAAAGVPADAIAQARDSLGGAVEVASKLPGQVGNDLIYAAKSQFVDGMSTSLMVGIAAILIGALVVFLFLPARAGDVAGVDARPARRHRLARPTPRPRACSSATPPRSRASSTSPRAVATAGPRGRSNRYPGPLAGPNTGGRSDMVSDAVVAVPRNRPGRQRSEAADQAILAATLDVLAAEGYGGLTMAAVIARSGVSSATLYRRWPTKQELVAAALASLHPAVVDVDTGSLEGDITAFVKSVAQSMTPQRDELRQDVAVALSANPDFRAAINEKFVVPRVLVLGHVLDRAREPRRARTGPAGSSAQRRGRGQLRDRPVAPPGVRHGPAGHADVPEGRRRRGPGRAARPRPGRLTGDAGTRRPPGALSHPLHSVIGMGSPGREGYGKRGREAATCRRFGRHVVDDLDPGCGCS